MLDIIGVGDANVDIMLRVAHLPAHDEKVRGQLDGYYPGGITANFCSAAAAFGAKVGAVCKVGTDPYGEMSLEDLKHRGVDISHMVVDPACETYFCMILLDDTGEKALTIVETSGFLPKPEEVDFGYLRTARRVHMTTLDMDLVDRVSAELAGSDTKLSLDMEATAGNCARSRWDRILGRVDIAFPNEAGLAALTGYSDIPSGAAALLERGVNMVVVTCGADGVKIFERSGERFSHPAYRVEVKDTTGAGDCFNAVFLSCMVKGWGAERAARYASAAAAISIGAVGARSALPSLDTVEKFLSEREA